MHYDFMISNHSFFTSYFSFYCLLLFGFPPCLFAQIQIGETVESTSSFAYWGDDVALSDDGLVLAFCGCQLQFIGGGRT